MPRSMLSTFSGGLFRREVINHKSPGPLDMLAGIADRWDTLLLDVAPSSCQSQQGGGALLRWSIVESL
jgi:hypothetical protein